jgi:anti-sigma factor RsiW
MRHLLLAFVALACSEPGECQVYGDQESVAVPSHLLAAITVDYRFSLAERSAIQSAANEWREATAGRAAIELVTGDADEWTINSVDRIDRCPNCAGLTDLGAPTIELSRTRIAGLSMFYAVALHELGHFFGLGHSSDPKLLMFGCYVGNDEITAGDVAMFDDLYDH